MAIPWLIFICSIAVINSAQNVPNQIAEESDTTNIGTMTAENLHISGKVDLPIQKRNFHFGGKTEYDILLVAGNNSYSSATPQSYRFNLSSPGNTELAVTFVDIELETTSNQVEANIVSGGIGQDNIVITLEGLDTTKFAYKISLYNSASRACALTIFMLIGLTLILSN